MLPPGKFRAARDAWAARARAAGDSRLAAGLSRLRRPTVSAWAVNLLARESPEQLAELLDLGAALREAQQELAGGRLRELSAQRRKLVTALTRQARRLAERAGQQVSSQTEREVDATLEAALADPDAAVAVRSGRLAKPLSYAGLGGIDLAGAVQMLPSTGSRRAAREPAGGQAPGRDDGAGRAAGGGRSAGGKLAAGRKRATREEARQRRELETAAARRELQAARQAAGQAAAALDRSERQLARSAGHHQAVRQRIKDLARQLEQAREQEAGAASAVRAARQQRGAAARLLASAQRKLTRAQQRAGQG